MSAAAAPPTTAGAGSRGLSLEGAAWGLLLVTVALIPLPRLTTLRAGSPIQASDLTLAVSAACFALHWALHRPRLRSAPVLLPIGGYLTAAVLSLANAPRLGASALKIVGLCSLAATLVLVVELCDRRRAEQLADVWLAVSTAVSALVTAAVVLFYAVGHDLAATRPLMMNYGSLPAGNYPRLQGLFLNGNMYCNYLVLSAGLWAWRAQPLAARFGRAPVAAALGALAVSVVFTLSTGWGGLAVGAIVLALAFRDRLPARLRGLVPLAVAGCALAAAFLAFITIAMIVPRGQGIPLLGPFGDVSTQPSGRLAGWISVLDTIRAHPLLGKGVGETVAHFTHSLATQGITGGAAEKVYDLEAHNVWLGLWGQIGVLGLASFAALSWRLHGLARAAAASDAVLGHALLAAFWGALLYHGLFGSFEDARYLWVFFGLMAASPSLARAPAA